jgi:uncharacterized membrane protein YkoI
MIKEPYLMKYIVQTAGMIVVILLIAGNTYGEASKIGSKPQVIAVATKISEEKAKEIALKEIPGTITSVVIEKQLGKIVYTIEILEKDTGEEVDVFVDVETGRVVGTDR